MDNFPKISTFLWLACLLFVLSGPVSADSPITSTPFSSAYSDEKIVITAGKANGELTLELMEFLSKPKNPIDLKMAVINELGWSQRIKNNNGIFSAFLVKKNRTRGEDEFMQKLTGDDLLSLAYLKAMDDYDDVTPAIRFANLALEQNPKSLTYNLIAGLIKAQKAMDNNWCEVFRIPDAIRLNSELTVDLRPEAIDLIFQYTDSYKEYCN